MGSAMLSPYMNRIIVNGDDCMKSRTRQEPPGRRARGRGLQVTPPEARWKVYKGTMIKLVTPPEARWKAYKLIMIKWVTPPEAR